MNGASVDTLLHNAFDKHPTGISPDGRLLVYSEVKPEANAWIVVVGTRQTERVDAANVQQLGGVDSLDGRWLALSAR